VPRDALLGIAASDAERLLQVDEQCLGGELAESDASQSRYATPSRTPFVSVSSGPSSIVRSSSPAAATRSRMTCTYAEKAPSSSSTCTRSASSI